MYGKKLLIGLLGITSLLVIAGVARADSSKLIKVDLDIGSTVLVRADLGYGDWYYWADTTACVCWVSGKNSDIPGSAAADCEKIAKHPRMKEVLKRCLPGFHEEAAAAPAATPSNGHAQPAGQHAPIPADKAQSH
ncbi:MAG: hypothetical protein AB7F43_13805 [Bacteriovoracia bacterium]